MAREGASGDVTTVSPAAHTVRLVDLLAELEAADVTDGAYEEVVLDGQLFREIVSTLRLMACTGDTTNGTGGSLNSATEDAGHLLAASESEFLRAVGRALEHEETATHRKAAVQWAEILGALRVICRAG
jgi:hypothetical protein